MQAKIVRSIVWTHNLGNYRIEITGVRYISNFQHLLLKIIFMYEYTLSKIENELNFLNVRVIAIIFSDKINIQMMKMKRTAT